MDELRPDEVWERQGDETQVMTRRTAAAWAPRLETSLLAVYGGSERMMEKHLELFDEQFFISFLFFFFMNLST